MAPKLKIVGAKDGQRYRVEVGGQTLYLTGTCFKLLALLGLERIRKGDGAGWVNVRGITHPPQNASRYMFMLGEQLEAGLYGTTVEHAFVESDRRGNYRLRQEPADIEFPDLGALVDFGDNEITRRLRGPNRVL